MLGKINSVGSTTKAKILADADNRRMYAVHVTQVANTEAFSQSDVGRQVNFTATPVTGAAQKTCGGIPSVTSVSFV